MDKLNSRIVPLPEVTNVPYLASRFELLLSLHLNQDIHEEFPEAAAALTGQHGDVTALLQGKIDTYNPADKQMLIPYVRDQGVGFAKVCREDLDNVIEPADVPKAVKSSWANISAFVMHPHRGKGVGSLLLKTCAEVVRTDFGGQAWTVIAPENIPSQKAAERAGFIFARPTTLKKNGEPTNLYLLD